MDLTQAMLAATDDPPPTRIDVDGLITGERRRTRRLYAVAGATLAAVLVGAVVGGVVVVQQPTRHDQAPGAAPPPAVASEEPPSCGISTQMDDGTLTGNLPLVRAKETCFEAVPRLSDALTTVLTTLLPDETITPPLPAELAKIAEEGAGYFSAFRIAGGDLEVRVRGSETTAAGFQAWTASRCVQATCRVQQHFGMSMLVRTTTGAVEVIILHTDGTMVSALARGGLTEPQLTVIAAAPTLTLYP